MSKPDMKKDDFRELSTLFFEMKQVIRANLPQAPSDPNSWVHSETLRFIANSNEPTMRDIAEHLRITAPSATSLVRSLMSRGWIERVGSTTDKRSVHVRLTAQGRKELAAYRARAEKTMRKVFSKLSKQDCSELKRILRRLRDVHRT